MGGSTVWKEGKGSQGGHRPQAGSAPSPPHVRPQAAGEGWRGPGPASSEHEDRGARPTLHPDGLAGWLPPRLGPSADARADPRPLSTGLTSSCLDLRNHVSLGLRPLPLGTLPAPLGPQMQARPRSPPDPCSISLYIATGPLGDTCRHGCPQHLPPGC
eukprot:bmy_09531T0